MSLPEWWANRDSRQRLNKNRDCQYWQPLFLFSEPDSSPTIRSIALGTTSYPAGPARIPASGIIGPGSSGILASAKTFMPLWAPHSSSYNAWGVKQYVVSLYRIVQSVPRTRPNCNFASGFVKELFQAQKIANYSVVSIAAPFVPVIAALICTTKRSVEGVRILDLLGHQKLKYSRQNSFLRSGCGR